MRGRAVMHVPFPKPLSPERLLPAWEAPFQLRLFFPLFYSNCTCANKILTGAKPRSHGERRELCSLPDPLALRQPPASQGQAAAGVPVGISATQKLVLQ